MSSPKDKEPTREELIDALMGILSPKVKFVVIDKKMAKEFKKMKYKVNIKVNKLAKPDAQ